MYGLFGRKKIVMASFVKDNSTVPSKEHILLTEEDIPGAKLPRNE